MVSDEKKTVNCTFRLPKDLLEFAQNKAKERDTSLSQVIRACLREYVEGSKPKRK